VALGQQRLEDAQQVGVEPLGIRGRHVGRVGETGDATRRGRGRRPALSGSPEKYLGLLLNEGGAVRWICFRPDRQRREKLAVT
jgi:hypothetical protein